MSLSPIAFECILAKRPASSMAGRRPKAEIVFQPNTDQEEHFYVAAVVARTFKKMADAYEISPGSRAEFLYELSRCESKCARERMHALIDRRDYSSKELSDKLRLDGYPQKIVDEVVARATETGMVDNKRFADVYIRSKLASGWGIQRIERELHQKGIEASDLSGWPYEYASSDDEFERAKNLIQRKRIPEKNAYPKLVRFLVSKGYSFSIASDVVKSYLDEQSTIE